MDDISNNVKKVLIVFLVCFIILISYITYFEMFVSQKIVSKPGNKRLWAERNEVLRGTIYDRNMKPLTKSERVDTLTQKREYTEGALFAHALGYVNQKYGITGLENKYDAQLMGAKDQSLMDFIKNHAKSKEKKGNNLVTTLSYDIQKAAFDALGDDKGAVVALDPKTGDILAMVSKPSFDPNDLDNIWKDINSNKDRPLLNRTVSGVYPPGSIFKTITAISALENINGVKNKTFTDNGSLVYKSKVLLKNYAGETFGSLSFKEAYKHSSNVVFGGLAIDLGNEKLKKTAEKFYFNNDTPCDGIVIDNSKFPKYESYEKGNIAQSGIGQSEVLATPMEMALVSATVANNGVMMKPHLVNKILDSSDKEVKSVNNESLGQKISTENAKVMQQLMLEVVSGGTGRNARVSGVKVAGKTGTADNGTGKGAHSWFIAFAPYENPKIALAVIVENGGQGGKKAATIASKVIKAAVKK